LIVDDCHSVLTKSIEKNKNLFVILKKFGGTCNYGGEIRAEEPPAIIWLGEIFRSEEQRRNGSMRNSMQGHWL
jgi:hypothetical protein